MKFSTTLALSCYLFIISTTSTNAQDIYSAWDNPSGYYATARTPNALCGLIGCPTFANPQHTVDMDMTNSSTITFPALSVLGSATITMNLTQTVTGYTGGVRVASSINFLSLSVLPSLEVALLNNSTVVATKTYATLLELSNFSAGNIVKLCVTPASNVSYNKVSFKVSVPVGVNTGLNFSLYNAYASPAGGCSIQGILPITLNNFNIKKDGDCNVLLNWSTASEQNTRHFEIERRTGSIDRWENIATIPAKGNSQAPVEYSYKDAQPGYNNFHYRLVVKDYDGRSEIFNGEKLLLTCGSTNTVVFPTIITGDHITIRSIQATSPNYYVRLLNLAGKEQKLTIEKNAGELKISFAPLASGMYVLQFGTGSTFGTRKLIVP